MFMLCYEICDKWNIILLRLDPYTVILSSSATRKIGLPPLEIEIAWPPPPVLLLMLPILSELQLRESAARQFGKMAQSVRQVYQALWSQRTL